MFRSLLQNALLGSLWSGKNPNLAVGKYTIDIEQDQFDFLGARLGHGFDYSTGLMHDRSGRNFTKCLQRVLKTRRTDMHGPAEGMIDIGDCNERDRGDQR